MITVYTQPNCILCKRVISKLHESSIEPEIVDVSRNKVAKDYLTRWLRAKSIPVIEADGFDPIIGYQPDKLKELIDAFSV